LQHKALQDSHTAHWLPTMPLTASFPGRTACKPTVRIRALMQIHTGTEACKRRSCIRSRRTLP